MFRSARITLTVWYLVIIMTVSVLFSVSFYGLATREFQRIIRIQEFRAEHPGEDQLRPRSFVTRIPNIRDLEEANNRLAYFLVVLNGVIFLVTGAAGYFLAGRTLRPIKEMVDEQRRFITDASHELRTPLTSLRSEIEVNLRNKTLSLDQAKKLLESNLEEVMSLQSLSDNLLELAQIGRGDVMKTNVSIALAFEQAVKRLNGSIKKKGMVIKKKVDDAVVHGMQESIISLFVILLDNAVKYSPNKSTVTFLAKKQDKSVKIFITDEGLGIALEDLPHIFDRFYRASKSRSKEKIPGYGLGLSIAKKIVTSHHGTISAESVTGKSTTFTIELPAK